MQAKTLALSLARACVRICVLFLPWKVAYITVAASGETSLVTLSPSTVLTSFIALIVSLILALVPAIACVLLSSVTYCVALVLVELASPSYRQAVEETAQFLAEENCSDIIVSYRVGVGAFLAPLAIVLDIIAVATLLRKGDQSR